MRSALLGVCFDGSPEHLRALVRASTRLTHKDPKAEWAAFAIALAAGHSCRGPVVPDHYHQELEEILGQDAKEFLSSNEAVTTSIRRGETTEQFADSIGLDQGVTGYCYDSVPVALHAWLSHQDDFRSAVLAAVRCGGDTDTIGAITGPLVGAQLGPAGLPQHWLSNLWEWPRTLAWMQKPAENLAVAIESGQKQRSPGLPYSGVLPRNVFFAVVVIGHALRRLLPPF